MVSNLRKLSETQKSLALKLGYDYRITLARFGKEFVNSGDYVNALLRYGEYFNIMAEAKHVKDAYSLDPKHFDPKIDLCEMLMISHIFFEMAKIYDFLPKFHEECKKCIDQFVLFSINQPYQAINSELARRSYRRKSFKNPDIFKFAYEQIFIKSNKCYIVTFCYGDSHPITSEYRKLKSILLNYKVGRELVRIYYYHSSELVNRWENNKCMKFFAQIVVKPILVLFSKTLLRFIVK